VLKTYLYVPEEIDKEIKNLAEVQKVSKAAVIRSILKEGITAIKHPKNSSGVEALLKIAALGKRINAKGPKDLSSNIDKYLWDNWNE